MSSEQSNPQEKPIHQNGFFTTFSGQFWLVVMFEFFERGAYYGMRGSPISQSSRRFKQRILEDNKLKKNRAQITTKMSFVES